MDTTQETAGPSLLFTSSAAGKVAELIAEEGNPNLKLRVFISGGGCSGFQYGLAFDDAHDDDTTLNFGEIKVLIDPMSADKVKGANVNYVETLQGAGFKISNPNAKTSCGCGSSFEV